MNKRRTKEVKKAASRRFDLWMELDLTTITIELILSVRHYPDDNKKSQWKKVARNHNERISVRSIYKRRDF